MREEQAKLVDFLVDVGTGAHRKSSPPTCVCPLSGVAGMFAEAVRIFADEEDE
jgi:hypothetical protein